MYTVYKHTNKSNGKVYIGITSQDVNRRWQNGAGYTGQVFKNAIDKYGWNGFLHEIIAENLTEQEACCMEQDLIARYQSNDHEHGYNIAEGGQVVVGNHDRKGKLNHKSSPVNVFDSDHNFINQYESQNIAAKELGINRKGITKNCLGESRTYKGYIFEYADKEYTKPTRFPVGKHNNHHTSKVVRLDKDGNILGSYPSIIEASKQTGFSTNGISKCCSGWVKSYLGSRWSYA